MDLQCIPADSCRWDYGSLHGTQRPRRKYLDKDRHTFDWCTLVLSRNLNSRDIQVDSWVVRQCKLLDTNKPVDTQLHGTRYMDRKVRDCKVDMACLQLAPLVFEL